jgi:hypothetical protein
VDDTEERISSFFIALMNPEDKDAIEDNKVEKFEGRIQYNRIYYVLEVPTEVRIYRSILGEQIDKYFLPRVLENFARVIISSRMNDECEPIRDWIGDLRKYEKYCDEFGRLLRMEIYGGVIPPWLSEEDRKKFTAKVRKSIIAYGNEEKGINSGREPIDGRESIKLFREFFNRYGGKINLINTGNLVDFFMRGISREKRDKHIPKNFINSLVNWYDYEVLNEVKESLYFYNEERIKEDILNYLCAVNYDPECKIKCRFTGKEIEVTEEFFKSMGSFFTGEELSLEGALDFAKRIREKYTQVIAQEPEKEITETELYQELFKSYVRNLKEKALQPFLDNENFREAIKSFGIQEFETFDTRLKEHIVYMNKNLINKFGYTEEGAKEICLYVIDQNLVEKFS